jgi:hypothetical protein
MQIPITTVLALAVAASTASAHRITAWSGTNKSGTSFSTTGKGTYRLTFYAHSYVWSSIIGDK